jgi:lipopolysaccharide export system permease protein
VILFRYFAREIFITMFAVAGIVLVISMGWRFSGYLENAAAGLMSREVLFAVMAYRLPGFLELIIPVSYFLSIMLVHGRMHEYLAADSDDPANGSGRHDYDGDDLFVA